MQSLLRLSACGVLLSVLFSGTPVFAQDAAVIKELSRLEDVWASTIAKKDGAALARIIAPNFLSMDSTGARVIDKATLIKDVSGSSNNYVSVTAGNYRGQVFGNTAVIIGVSTLVTKTAKGNETRRVAWTDTWMKQADGQWLCIASQSSPVQN